MAISAPGRVVWSIDAIAAAKSPRSASMDARSVSAESCASPIAMMARRASSTSCSSGSLEPPSPSSVNRSCEVPSCPPMPPRIERIAASASDACVRSSSKTRKCVSAAGFTESPTRAARSSNEAIASLAIAPCSPAVLNAYSCASSAEFASSRRSEAKFCNATSASRCASIASS